MAKFEVGEVCEAFDADTGNWDEVTVVAIGVHPGLPFAQGWSDAPDYTIEDSSAPWPDGSCMYVVSQYRLRKRKQPPESDHIPEEVRKLFDVPQVREQTA